MRVLVSLSILVLASCGSVKTDKKLGAETRGDVSIELPSRGSFDAERQELLDGFFLTIQPVGESCVETEPRYIVSKWRDEPIKESLWIDCDYLITLDLGTLDGEALGLSAVYFTNRLSDGKGQKISGGSSDLSSVEITLRVTQEGKDAGFSGVTDVVVGCGDEGDDEDEDEDRVNDDVIDWGGVNDPLPPAQDDNGLSPLLLTADQDVTLSTGSGSSKLSDFFQSEYLVIDLSSTSCSYCIQLAKDHQSDGVFNAMFSNDKCRFLTVVTSSQLSSWKSIIGSGYVTERSVGYGGGLSSLGSKFGVSVSSIPNVFVIDREGEVVAEAVGSIPSEVTALCQ